MKIYCVRDAKAQTFNTPFFQPSDVHALRAFRAEVNRNSEQNMMYLYPEDWELRYLGEFNEQTGLITPANDMLTNGTAVALPREK